MLCGRRPSLAPAIRPSWVRKWDILCDDRPASAASVNKAPGAPSTASRGPVDALRPMPGGLTSGGPERIWMDPSPIEASLEDLAAEFELLGDWEERYRHVI